MLRRVGGGQHGKGWCVVAGMGRTAGIAHKGGEFRHEGRETVCGGAVIECVTGGLELCRS